MTRRQKIATSILRPINTSVIVLLGIYTVVWGIWLANPFWSAFQSAKLFSALGLVAPEVFWGTLAIVCGCITIFGVFRGSYRALTTGAATAGFHWMMIAVFYFIGDWMNTGGITSLTFAIYAGFIYLNLRVNFHEDPEHVSRGLR